VYWLTQVVLEKKPLNGCSAWCKLVLRKIINIGATRCYIFKLKRKKFHFVWGPTPDPTGGAYSALPDPLAGFKGAYFFGNAGEEREGRIIPTLFPPLLALSSSRAVIKP